MWTLKYQKLKKTCVTFICLLRFDTTGTGSDSSMCVMAWLGSFICATCGNNGQGLSSTWINHSYFTSGLISHVRTDNILTIYVNGTVTIHPPSWIVWIMSIKPGHLCGSLCPIQSVPFLYIVWQFSCISATAATTAGLDQRSNTVQMTCLCSSFHSASFFNGFWLDFTPLECLVVTLSQQRRHLKWQELVLHTPLTTLASARSAVKVSPQGQLNLHINHQDTCFWS